MGLILSANCACGINGEVQAGSGELEGSACIPAYCKSCQRLVTVSTSSRRPRCKHCRSSVKLIQVFDPNQPGVEEEPQAPIQCPRCGKQTLRFELTGLWD